MSFISKTIKYVVVYPAVAVVALGVGITVWPKDEVKIAACIQTHGEQYCDLFGDVLDKAKVDATIAKKKAKTEAKIAKEKAETEAKIAKEKAETEAKELKVAATEAKQASDKRKGFHCLSAWNGAHNATVEYTKNTLRDPESFKHIETKIWPANPNGEHQLVMQYRAKNGFGGMTVGSVVAKVKNDGCYATIIKMS